MGKTETKTKKIKVEVKEYDEDEIEKEEDEEEENEINKSFINISLIKHDETNKIFLDIIWIDEKVFNSENQYYFEKMKLSYPNIKINLYDDLEEGFNNN